MNKKLYLEERLKANAWKQYNYISLWNFNMFNPKNEALSLNVYCLKQLCVMLLPMALIQGLYKLGYRIWGFILYSWDREKNDGHGQERDNVVIFQW